MNCDEEKSGISCAWGNLIMIKNLCALHDLLASRKHIVNIWNKKSQTILMNWRKCWWDGYRSIGTNDKLLTPTTSPYSTFFNTNLFLKLRYSKPEPLLNTRGKKNNVFIINIGDYDSILPNVELGNVINYNFFDTRSIYFQLHQVLIDRKKGVAQFWIYMHTKRDLTD